MKLYVAYANRLGSYWSICLDGFREPRTFAEMCRVENVILEEWKRYSQIKPAILFMKELAD